MATNKHCVVGVRNCSSEIYFMFPDTRGYSAEGVACEEIEKISSYKLDKIASNGEKVISNYPDYAFISLSKNVERPVLKMNQSGLGFSQKVTAHYFDSVSKYSKTIVLKEKQCSTGYAKAILNTYYLEPKSPVVGLFNCGLKPGNSGGPILNSNGEVSAIIHSGGTESKKVSAPGVNTDKLDLSKHGSATNLSCIDFEELDLYKTADSRVCKVGLKRKASDYKNNKLMQDKTIVLIKNMIAQLLELNDPEESNIFEWRVKPAVGTKKVDMSNTVIDALEVIPNCIIRPEDERSSLNKYKSYSYGVVPNWERNASLRLQTDVVGLEYEIDERAVLELLVVRLNKKSQYSFNPKELASLGNKDKALILEIARGSYYEHKIGYCDLASKQEFKEQLLEYEEALDMNNEDFLKFMEKERDKSK